LSQILKNLFTSDSSLEVEIREDNLLDVAFFREVFKESSLDKIYKINSVEKILSSAKNRIGEKGYDIITDNCQHFCTYVRYGVAVAIEIEETTFEGFFSR